MEYTLDGRPYIHAIRPRADTVILPETAYQHKLAENMPTTQIRHSLCSLGPAKCAECGMCAYGREYVRRVEHVG